MEKHITLACLLVLFASCTREKKEMVKDYEELLTTDTSLSVDSVEKFKQSNLYQEIMDLDEADIDDFIHAEIATMQPGEFRVGPSAPATGDTTAGPQRCLSFDSAPRDATKSFARRSFFSARIFPRTYVIPVHLHIIELSATEQVVNNASIKEQFTLLNAAFTKANIRFDLVGIHRKTAPEWYTCQPTPKPSYLDSLYGEMTGALALTPTQAINVFVNGMSPWGFANYPWSDNIGSSRDVVMVKDHTFPDHVASDQQMRGHTLIHEMGHYFGLFHTFHDNRVDTCNVGAHDGCSIGDDVPDTPPQKICHFWGCGPCNYGQGCDPCPPQPAPCRTCGGQTEDPVKNYMGYNPDDCTDHFTDMQYDRMVNFFFNKRYYLARP